VGVFFAEAGDVGASEAPSDSEYGGQGRERAQAALLLASRGRRERFESW
jgi:hypothetical protein